MVIGTREGVLAGRAPTETSRGVSRRVVPHVVGISWVIGAAMLTLAPALHHGLSLGPYDILSQSGLTRVLASPFAIR